MKIAIVAPARSGSELLQQVLLAGPFDAVVHDKQHGLGTGLGNLNEPDIVVTIVRDPDATEASQVAAFGSMLFDRQESIDAIAESHPDAIAVTYEDLCADPEGTVAYLADQLGVEPWPVPVEITDQNAKWTET